jgi:hypothetical protein
VVNRLFIVGRFAHDAQGILATVGKFAFVGIKSGLNLVLEIGLEL